jgi:D-serine deaminase-like pyridoxal phosphate-dependent protein
MKTHWYDIDFSEIDTPALMIDREMVRSNIRLAIKYAGGTHRLRPHVKTHKMLEISNMEIEEGIYKFKCATIPEAEMLGMAKAKDVLIAYPVQGPKIDRVVSLINTFSDTHYSFLIDNIDTSTEVNEKFRTASKTIDVFIDINNGQNRTGIIIDDARKLIPLLRPLNHINLVGLHCYDGHIRSASLEERTNACRQAISSVVELRDEIQADQHREIKLVAGGSPSFSVHAKYHDVECSPGTFVLWDARYGGDYAEQEFQKAAVLVTRVISQIDTHTFCLDLGHKSVASEFPFPRVQLMLEDQPTQIGHSEEHLIIQCEKANALNVGQLIIGYPYHICPTVALYDHVYVASNGKIIDQWAVIARNRKITI